MKGAHKAARHTEDHRRGTRLAYELFHEGGVWDSFDMDIKTTYTLQILYEHKLTREYTDKVQASANQTSPT